MTRRPILALALAAAAPLSAVAAAPASAATAPEVTVMSRNLYLGADIITAAVATDRADLQQRATALLRVVRQTNFPLRAKAIANEIRATRPDLIGLQEVAKWRRTKQGVTNDAKDANVVVYDFLASLRKELRKRHLSYAPAVVQQEADFEVPTSEGFDVRLTMRDVILVRTGKGAKVKVRRTLKGNYRDNLVVPIPAGVVESLRGWTAADVTVGSRKLRFVNTHLEAYGGEIREKQAKQLLVGPLASKKRQAIVVGDLNSDARDAAPDNLAVNAFLGAGFIDAFRTPPATSGQDEKLDNTTSKLQRYIDHVMSRPALKAVRTKIVGNKRSDRVGGLWPSDHAGTVATLRLKK